MKKGMKKTIGIIMTIALLLGIISVNGLSAKAANYYGVYICGTGISTETTSGNGWSFDPETFTLTLDNFQYIGDVPYMLAGIANISGKTLTILLKGENQIDIQRKNSGDKTFYGIAARGDGVGIIIEGEEDATLHLNVGGKDVVGAFGINAFGDVTINGGDIYVETGDAEYSSVDIECRNFTMNDGKLTAIHGVGLESYAVDAVNTVLINGGCITCDGSDLNMTEAYSVGLRALDKVEITGGEVYAYSGNIHAPSEEGKTSQGTTAIYGRNSVSITGGSVYAESGDADLEKSLCAGISSDGTLEIKSGVKSVVFASDRNAIECKEFIRDVEGEGWTDKYQNEGHGIIGLNTDLDEIDNYKSVRFPLLTIQSKVKGYNGAYDGKSHGIKVTVTDPKDGYLLLYGTKEDRIDLSDCPKFKEPGKYTVYYQILAGGYKDLTGSETVTITRAQQKITAKDMNLKVGQTSKINATTSGDGKLSYMVSGNAVTVDKNGNVKAIKSGTATVIITASKTKHYNAGSTEIKVTVAEKTVDMLRLYNPNSGEHFYTASVAEKDTLVKAGWKYEGFAWKAPAYSKTPVYRLYNKNAGDHHYTISRSEKESLEKAGWAYEGIGWYSDDAKAVPLYRLYNHNAKAGAHHYTTSESETKALIDAGWIGEGIAWYGR